MATENTRQARSYARASADQWLKIAGWKLASLRGSRIADALPGETDIPEAPRCVMRLFAKGCPANAVREVIESLASKGTFSGLEVDGMQMPGEWTHRFAIWSRDSATAENGDATKTIVWELGDSSGDAFSSVVDDGCGSRTTVRYEFDKTEIEDISLVEHAGEQGFSVRIGGVSRDQESHLFFYYVTVTERKTQALPEKLVSEDAFTRSYEATWTGLRGTQAAPTDDSGGAVSVPDPASRQPGETISSQFSLNQEDCTLNAQSSRRVAIPSVAAGSGCSKDVFSEQDTTEVSGASAALGHAPAAAAGVSWEYRSKLRPDGKYDTVKASRKEREVDSARVTTSVDAFGVETSETSRGKTSAPEVPVAGGGVSGTLAVEVTQGNLKTVTVGTRTEATVAGAQSADEATLFSRRRRTVTRSTGAPVPEASAGGGTGASVTASLTPGGRRDVSLETTEEIAAPASQVSDSETAFESVHRYTDVHSRDARPPASFSDGVAVETSEDLQPLGSRNISVVVRTEKDVPQAAFSDAKTVFETERSVEGVSSGVSGEAPAPFMGRIVTVRDVLTPAGKHRKTLTETQERYVQEAEVTTVKTVLGTRVRTTSRNAVQPLELETGERGTVSRSMTPGGLWNTSKETVSDTIGASGFHSYEDHFLGRSEVHKSIVANQTGLESRLVGRSVISDSFVATDGGGWERTRSIETCPESRKFTLLDQIKYQVAGTLFTIPAVDSHSKMILFMNATMEEVSKEVTLFTALYKPFIRTTGFTTYFFSYTNDVSVGLRPDKFGTWSGILTMQAELINRIGKETTEVGT